MNNREQSFNKIFNSSPLVGVIQPRGKEIKLKKKLSNPRLPPLNMNLDDRMLSL